VFILDEPYVSTALKNSVLEQAAPVLDTPFARRTLGPEGAHLLRPDAEFAAAVDAGARLYCNSENSLDWVAAHLRGGPAPMVRALKDKAAFRRLLAPMFPDFFFREATMDGLRALDPATLPFPCVVKPAVGFFSLGVQVVDSAAQWPAALDALERDAAAMRGLYPDSVVSAASFVVEECLQGEEYAVDAYFDARGEPVVCNVLHHWFSSGSDVSDRVYVTSAELVCAMLPRVTDFLRRAGELAGLRDFPLHAELRVDAQGRLAPIEFNPLRFAGWCTTDVAFHAYGTDPYRHYLDNLVPDWEALRRERAGLLYSILIAELPGGVDPAAVTEVDYAGLARRLSRPLEVRQMDWARHRVLAFLFAETRETERGELEAFLRADLAEHVRTG
jgi:hypothetical protein